MFLNCEGAGQSELRKGVCFVWFAILGSGVTGERNKDMQIFEKWTFSPLRPSGGRAVRGVHGLKGQLD